MLQQPVIRASDLNQFLQFACIGAVATLFHFGVLFLLVTLRVCGPVSGSMAGFVVGACVSYVLNRMFTFRSNRTHRSALPRFMTIAGVGALFNLGIMYTLTQGLRIYYLPAQAIATVLVLGWNFAGAKLWALSHQDER